MLTLHQIWENYPRVHLDAQDIQELIGNVLDNALRWANDEVTFRVWVVDQMLWLSVSDDGPGMTQQESQEALGRGKRLDEQRSQSGLGLAIVADLITLYHGQKCALARRGRGIEVTVELPVVALWLRENKCNDNG